VAQAAEVPPDHAVPVKAADAGKDPAGKALVAKAHAPKADGFGTGTADAAPREDVPCAM